MKERLIWRPNGISPERWQAMTRQEQIDWWRQQDAQRPEKPKRHMLAAVEWYEEGVCTETDFCTQVVKLADLKEIEEFVAKCPAELMQTLRKYIDSYGNDESKWPRTFSLTSYAPWVTTEEIKDSCRQEQERIWAGVRFLKEHLT